MVGIVGVYVSGHNYFYLQGEYEDGLLFTYNEMYNALQRGNRLYPHITDAVLDEDEYDATDSFFDDDGELL